MLLELTHDDLIILEKQRLERFRAFFNNTLPFCFLHLDQTYTLAIHCSEPGLVDQLLSNIGDIRKYAWLMVGAYRISIYYAQEEIYTSKTQTFARRALRSRTPKA